MSTGEISTLFAIWSVVSFAFEVPSGALADAWSRRGLYAIGELLTAAGYALWLSWPAFPGFALGFVLCGLGGDAARDARLRRGRLPAGGHRMILAVAVAALLPGFSALDEYLPLLAREKGAPTTAVPLLFALTALAMAAGSALAGRYAAPPLPAGAAVVAAVLLAAGALTANLAGMVVVAAAFGLLQFATLRAETRLQEQITGAARTTVLSVSGFAAEVFAVVLYAWFALPITLTTLFAIAAIPLLGTAALEVARRR
ncbi:hypothetical protein [Paractinoplanes ferrugineus]|uniref:hypothetical protein n=1 Tax=Paractinoplanes ferrugineus TaxID=113564 RepID=UPI003F694330